MAYDIRALGDYAKDFDLVRESVKNTILEFTASQVGKLDVQEEDGKPTYDEEQFFNILRNIHTVRERSDILTALFYDGFKLLNEMEKDDERTDNEGIETE